MNIALNWLPGVALTFVLIFARVGAMMMLLPALGEQVIPGRVRLAFAMALSVVLFPLVAQTFPDAPLTIPGAIAQLLHEVGVGLILGGIARMVVSSAQVAGATMAFQMGLSIAQTADPSQPGVQGALIGNFLAVLGVTLIFATDLHHLLISGIYSSYSVFSPTTPLMFKDASDLALRTAAEAFRVGVQISAPFIVFGLIFNLGLGLLSKLMPQLQVYFIAMPANVGIGLVLLALLLTVTMAVYLQHFQAAISLILG